MSLRLTSLVAPRLIQELTSSGPLNQVRYRHTKHWNPKWKHFRRLKVIKVELPKYNEKFEELSEEEVRSRMKRQGVLPPRPWMEKPMFISSTGGVFEPYVPPEGDGKISPITAQGAKQKLEFLGKKSKTMMAIRKVKTFDEDFETPEFCKHAQDVYNKMHECMTEHDEEKIRDYVTERAYPEVMHNLKNKTIRWKFLKNIELPYIVHARCTDIITKENIFAQITVRFHTQQILAIYDRFGRLMHGSEILAKDVIEYVVFEKHLANQYGAWRIHEKIIPDWMPPKEPSALTFKELPEPPPEPEPVEQKKETLPPSIEAGKQKEIAAA